jgi:hypothetical protein
MQKFMKKTTKNLDYIAAALLHACCLASSVSSIIVLVQVDHLRLRLALNR